MAGEPERQRGCRPSCSGRPLVEGIASIDLFVVPTIAFQPLFAFLVLGHKRRQLLWFAVTRNPTAEWWARQITEAFPWDRAPRYLVRDNDRPLRPKQRRRESSPCRDGTAGPRKSPVFLSLCGD